MKRFSFVIPTYQRKLLLKNTLEVLNNQKGYAREDYEVIVVDDGSTDGTGDYIEGINRNYELKYLYLERCSQSGRSRARNAGWREAEGEIVVFTDSDILVKDNYLSELDRCFSANSDIQVIGNGIMLLNDIPHEVVCHLAMYNEFFTVRSYKQFEQRHYRYHLSSYNAEYQFYPWLQVFSGNMAVPRKWLCQVGGFDEGFMGWGHEDIELGCRLYKAGLKVILNSKLDVLHQYHGHVSPFVDRNKFSDIDRNTEYLLKKHPDALNAPRGAIFDMLRGKAEIDLEPEPKIYFQKIKIEFKEKDRLEEVKNTISELSNKKKKNIMVFDYVEDTDLDIWIQLLGKRESTPRYFPVSRKFEIERVCGPFGTGEIYAFKFYRDVQKWFRLRKYRRQAGQKV